MSGRVKPAEGWTCEPSLNGAKPAESEGRQGEGPLHERSAASGRTEAARTAEGWTCEPTESVEQQRLFQWARYASGKLPALALMYHIPNEGKRSRAAGGRLKAEGLKPGVPDICLPVARGGNHGLYIELKRIKSGRLSQNQLGWLDALRGEGYAVAVCRGWEEASRFILEYLESKPKGGEPIAE